MEENLTTLKKKSEEAKTTIHGADEVKEEEEDQTMRYQNEAFKSFVDIIQDEELLTRIMTHIPDHMLDNVLATLALEYAETRGNLNKEQSFVFLSIYQFAVSRQYLINTY